MQCVWLRAKLDLSVDQISIAVGLKKSTVSQMQSRFLRKGSSILKKKKRGGRYHQNLSIEQEKNLLSQFNLTAEQGHMLVISEVQAAYEKKVGHKVPPSTVYRMLKRHGWRKVAPRPRHPKTDDKKQQEFKKNSH